MLEIIWKKAGGIKIYDLLYSDKESFIFVGNLVVNTRALQ